ncbi:MAG: transcriptional repressor [Clostridia bacterium]|nr:transcriptional repressor [Clostridia bacterium]
MEVYKTKQRELVLSYLKDNNRCMSADEIIAGLRDNGHAVSKTTVYRCLELFSNAGQASKFLNSQGESAVYRYSGGHDSHFHLKCTECNKTVCADCGFINRMQEHFYNHHGFTVSKTHTVIYGLCRDCGRSKGETSE